MQTPDITPVQAIGAALLALLQAAIGISLAFGVVLTSVQIGAIEGAFTAFVGVLVVVDLQLRKARLAHLPEIVQSKALAAQAATAATDATTAAAETTKPKSKAKKAA